MNIVSNLLVAMAQEVFFDLQCEDGVEISKVRGDYAHTKTWSGCRISLGTLQIGQLRDIALQVLMEKPEGDSLGRSRRRRTHKSSFMKYRLDPPKLTIPSAGCAGGSCVAVSAALVSMAASND